MTKQKLERGIELQRSIDNLYRAKEELEQAEKLCFEDMDIAKVSAHIYALNMKKKEGTSSCSTLLSEKAAHMALCTDIKDIDMEIERLEKEFAEL